jgi:hypothetical protein
MQETFQSHTNESKEIYIYIYTSTSCNYKTQQRNVKIFPCVKALQNKQKHRIKN